MRLVTECVLLSVILAGCGSSEPKFYTLQRVIGPTENASLGTVEVGRPGLAGYLDRPEIVLKDDSFRLSTDDQQRWAEPLGDMIGRVITQNLSQRLRNSSVYDQGGAITATPDARVEVDIISLNQDDSGSVALSAQVAIVQGVSHRTLAARHVTLQQTADGSGPTALVATMSTLLGTLSDRIASDVRSSSAALATPAPVAAVAPAAAPVSLADATPAHVDVPADTAKNVTVAANTPAATLPVAAPSAPVVTPALAISPAPVAHVAAGPLSQCESGGHAVPCLQAP